MASPAHVQGMFLRHSERLRGFIHALVGSHQDADDILQDVFLVVLEKAGDYAEGSDFLAWTRAIARFRVLHHLERQRRRRSLDPDVIDLLYGEAQADAVADRDWDREITALRDCLRRLGPAARGILGQRYDEGLLPGEIAARSGRTVNGVSVALAKVRSALRACIERRLQRGGTPA
jgi:RNA polymerase sigma-70 factor (ECF subfamily)